MRSLLIGSLMDSTVRLFSTMPCQVPFNWPEKDLEARCIKEQDTGGVDE